MFVRVGLRVKFRPGLTLPIAVGSGGAGGAVAPPDLVQNVENRRKFGQMVYLFGQIVWIFGHIISPKYRLSFGEDLFFFFFFFFGELLHLDRKTVQISGKTFLLFFFFFF